MTTKHPNRPSGKQRDKHPLIPRYRFDGLALFRKLERQRRKKEARG